MDSLKNKVIKNNETSSLTNLNKFVVSNQNYDKKITQFQKWKKLIINNYPKNIIKKWKDDNYNENVLTGTTFNNEKNILDNLFIKKFKFLNWIGNGNFGKIYKIYDINWKIFYSCKIFKNNKYNSLIENEVRMISYITKICRSKFLIKYIDSYKIDNKYYLITELCKSSVANIFKNNIIKEKTLLKLIKHITKGLLILHKNNIVHWDIKPENICLGFDNKYKLIDFGLCKNKLNIKNLKEGDARYMSLDFFEKDIKFIDFSKSDIFSLGLTLYKLMTRIDLEKNGIVFQSLRKNKNNLDGLMFYSKNLKFLVNKMLDSNWKNRPSCKEILTYLKQSKQNNY